MADWAAEHGWPIAAEIEAHQARKAERNFALWEAETAHAQGNVTDAEYTDWVREIGREFDLPLTTPEELAAMLEPSTAKEAEHLEAAQAQQDALRDNLMPSGLGAQTPIGPNTRRIVETFLAIGETSGHPLEYFHLDRWHLIGATADPYETATGDVTDSPLDPALDVDAAVRRIELGLAPFDTAAGVDQFTDGGAFIFDQPETLPAVWGHGTEVLWAEGESLMIAGSMGLGKTTLAGQVIRARLGLGDGAVLGLPVAPTDGTILYLAMDRPRQIARSLARQFKPAERATVTRQLAVWQGPPPADVAADPDTLLNLALRAGANTVVIDSVKDAAIGLSDDTVGAGYNRARQKLIAAGIQLLELHHLVKRNAQGGAPSTAADVYGSTWLANGTGSIIMLTGEPGDPVVGFRHVRQPAEEVGPFELLHDQTAGEITIHQQAELLDALRAAAADGLTASAAVAVTHPGEKLSGRAMAAAREKARRALDKYVRDGEATRLDGAKGGDPRLQQSATWFAA